MPNTVYSLRSTVYRFLNRQISNIKYQMFAERGFSLVELLVVITIVGTVATTGIFMNATTSITKAKDSQRTADLEQIKSAVDLYYQDNNCYPPTAAPADSTFLNALANGTIWQENNVVYMKKVPKDPVSGAYVYKTDTVACPQWMILSGQLSNATSSNKPCPLPTYVTGSSTCMPGYNASTACVSSGSITCAAPTPTPPGVIIPTNTPIPTVPVQGVPTFVANSVTADTYTMTGATFHAVINTNGSPTTYWWNYGTTDIPCNTFTNHTQIGNIQSGSYNASRAFSGFNSGTKYYFCAVAQNSVGTTYSPVSNPNPNFTTLPAATPTPTCTTGYQDFDKDGYGVGASPGCFAASGSYNVVQNNTDCDDANAGIYQSLSLVADPDQDRYYTGSAAMQCVGAATPVAQAITYKSSNATSGVSSVGLGAPSSVAPGDFLLLVSVISYPGASPAYTTGPTSSGFTQITSVTNTNGNSGTRTVTAAYYKVATVSDVGTTYMWSANGNIAVAVLRYTGVDPTSPIDTAGSGVANYTSSTTNTTFQGPSITTNNVNALVVHIPSLVSSVCGNPRSFTPPAGFSEHKESGSTTSCLQIEESDIIQAVQGGVAAQTATANGAGYGGTLMLALKPFIRNYYNGGTQNSIAQLGTTNPNTGSGTTLTLLKPALLSNGDMLVAYLCYKDPSAAPDATITAAPVGWTMIDVRKANSTTGLVCYAYYKPIPTAASEPTNYTWTWSENLSSLTSAGTILTLDSTNGGTVAFDKGLGSLFTTGGSTKTLTGITTANNNETLLGLWSVAASSTFSGYSLPVISAYMNNTLSFTEGLGLQATQGLSTNKNVTAINGGIGAGFLAGFYVTPGTVTNEYTDNVAPITSGDCAPNDNTKWVNMTGYPDIDGDNNTLGQQTICTNGSLPAKWYASPIGSVDCFDGDAQSYPGSGGGAGVRGDGTHGNDLAGDAWDSGDWNCDGTVTYSAPYPAYSQCATTSNASQYTINGSCLFNPSPSWPTCTATSPNVAPCGTYYSLNMSNYSNAACTVPINNGFTQICQ